MTDDEFLAKAAYDLALVAAPIYAENSAMMRKSLAISTALREAAALIGAAKEFIQQCA